MSLRSWLLLLLTGVTATPALGQSAVERPPNLNGAWVAAPGVLQFNFLHRFNVSPPPERKVQSSPTFLVALGLPASGMVGFSYATSSSLVDGFPNEWEFFGRVMPLRERDGGPLDAALHLGYNQAAASVDVEVTVARSLGPLGVFAAGRGMSNYAWRGDARYAVAGGATLRLSRAIGVTGDVATLFDRADDEDVAWSAGVQIGIPYTPHTFSLHATSANTGTVQGASAGSGSVRYGFDYTVPITLRRYVRGGAVPEPPVLPAPGTDAVVSGEVVQASIGGPDQPMAYLPGRLAIEVGTTVVWTNRDALEHTVTDRDGSFDSGLIAPGESWRHTFDEPGTFEIVCTPHPFMQGVLIVTAPGGQSE